MRPILSSVLAVLAGALVGSCYAERQPPPSFRYVCDKDGDCRGSQECIDGLCETPCTLLTFEEDCLNGELVCLNGVCSSGCDVDKDTCPGAQQCVDLDLDVSGGGGFFGGGDSDVVVGVCMRPCTNTSCGELHVCIEGFCVQTCVDDEQCPPATSCQQSLCLPDLGLGTDSASGETSDSLTGLPTGTESGLESEAGSASADATATGGAT